MNTNWSKEELETLYKLKETNLKTLQLHFPDKSKSTIVTALKELETMRNRKIERKSKKDHFRAIELNKNTNTVLYGLMLAHNVPAKQLAKELDCSIRTIQGVIQGERTTEEKMEAISKVFGVPVEVIFWQIKGKNKKSYN